MPEQEEPMIKKILRHECGGCDDCGCEEEYEENVNEEYARDNNMNRADEADEFASDEMELAAIGKSEYFSTCEYKMISNDGNLTGQGS